MPQRDDAPREEWEPRGAKRAFQALEDQLRDELEKALSAHTERSDKKHKEMEDRFMTWKGFALFIVPLIMAIVGLVGFAVVPVRDAASATVQKAEAMTKTIDARLAEQDKSIARQGASVEAVMRVTVDGKPRKQVQKEWETKTGVPRIDAAP